ncbi:energy transducer TonB [Aurantibacter crassamenti]|uniref:energy transducer TonB family protein n=1 Tax=Aurantibacter crassamenti TaxID=1837375 RepID=UPI001939417E|nr:energy transducer TonB [Aurantibacter crassamenti]MBM1104809.1 energy transducer TonB [Aurantibacter crassamenti]
MNLNRKQLSLIITVFSMGIMILGLYNLNLGKAGAEEDEYIVEMMLAEEDIQELLEEKEALEDLANAEPIESHMAFNETAKPSYGDPEPLKTLAELMAEKEGSTDEPFDGPNVDSEYAERVKELAKKREEKKQLLGEKEAEKKEFTNNLAKRKTSVSYSLVNRNNYRLPPPIYTCIEGGKVVVNITVNSLGNVTHADFNSKSSGTSNGCLVDNAIAYALKARFNAAEKSSQKGTITYIFQQKAR